MQLFSIDPGNRRIKYYLPGVEPGIMDSVCALVSRSQSVVLDEDSVVIDYMAGKEALVGQRWVVGKAASDFRSAKTTFTQKKVDVIDRLALAAIATVDTNKPLTISTLYVSYPDPHLAADEIRDRLIGTHEYVKTTPYFSHNVRLEILDVVVMPEGYGSIAHAHRASIINFDNGLVALIDLGGGTAIGSLWKGVGQEVPDTRVVLQREGSFGLASQIAMTSAMRKRMGDRGFAKAEVVMDGIENNSFEYGTTGVDFKDIFDECLSVWWENIYEQLAAHWTPWDFQIASKGGFLITGGAMPLIQNAINESGGLLVACPNNQFANVIGMMPDSNVAKLRSKAA